MKNLIARVKAPCMHFELPVQALDVAPSFPSVVAHAQGQQLVSVGELECAAQPCRRYAYSAASSMSAGLVLMTTRQYLPNLSPTEDVKAMSVT